MMSENSLDEVLQIRIAHDSELEQIYTIWLRGIDNSFNRSAADMNIIRDRFHANFLARAGIFNFWVAVDKQGIVQGWQSLIRTSYNPFRLDAVAESSTYITPGCQYKGVGLRLLEFAIQEAEKSELLYIFAFVSVENKAALKITDRTGWHTLGELPPSPKAPDSIRKYFLVRPV